MPPSPPAPPASHASQEYLHDTLPRAIPANELQPGDLVFWTGEYDDPSRKPHRHNLVHVEVYVGGRSGEATVGSRYEGEEVSEPGVAEFDSYRTFGGHGAHGHALTFKSIDTWLDGASTERSKPRPHGAPRGGGARPRRPWLLC